MAGLGAKDILRNITALEQLIEEINFQRAKEMRQCLMSKDSGSDSSFLILQGTTYWTDLFVRHFLFQTDRSTDADDLLFFIRKRHIKGSRHVPKYHTEVEVYRKDSRKLPIGDPDVDWEETVYLNLIIHQFDYTLTLAICTRTSPKELQVLKRHSQKVYASPSQRRMDTKGEVEEITYPNVCFHVDNFDEVFADMLVRDGEMVCVELVASGRSGTRQAVLFLGSIRYDALKRVYDARASLSSKVAQRMMLALFSGSGTQRIEFVRMKGPQGKGHAEMAVLKPKGSGVETPTSEPGVNLTDLWDSDWEDEPEDRFLYHHQRRLSDPSANFNTFIHSGWKSRGGGDSRSRSENEGLDMFADGLYEIESGDVRDAACSGKCCSVIACRNSASDEDVHPTPAPPGGSCDKCSHFHRLQSDLESKCDNVNKSTTHNPVASDSDDDFVFIDKEDLDIAGSNIKLQKMCAKTTLRSEERSPSPTEEDPFIPKVVFSKDKHSSHLPKDNGNPSSSSLKRPKKERPGAAIRVVKISSTDKLCRRRRHLVPSKTFPIPVTAGRNKMVRSRSFDAGLISPQPLTDSQLHPSGRYKPRLSAWLPEGPLQEKTFFLDYNQCVRKKIIGEDPSFKASDECFPPKKVKVSLPFRGTRDGRTICYFCDLKLDDGAYNPLWTMKGFTQTFHFWKESRRAQSVPLNAYLTYVTLPWFTIITDILDHRTGPILTF